MARRRPARPRRFRRLRRTLVLAAAALLLGAGVAAARWLSSHASAIRDLARGAGDTVFLDDAGRPWFALDESRSEVPLAAIAPALRQAVVAIEDRRFHRHRGLDPVAIARALAHNLRSGAVREGASTITQQLARTLFLSRERSLGRKAREAALALLLERYLTKDRILELYLNRVPLGPVHGVEAFAREHYGKGAAALTLAESAVVAGAIRAPSALSPRAHPDRALARGRVVLAALREQGYIGEAEERAARAAPPRVTGPRPLPARERSGYAQEFLRRAFRAVAGEESPPGWRVQTTFNVALQREAEAAVAGGLARLGRPGLQAALVAVDPATGDILALTGGDDFAAAPYNRAVHARRQPGSAFKPFVYAAALARGDSPLTRLPGIPAPAFAAEARERGLRVGQDDPAAAITYREALAVSDNAAALAVQQRVGTDAVIRLAAGAGLPGQPAVDSLALGTGLATPLDLTAAYAPFVNGGWAVRPRAIAAIADQRGAEVHRQAVATRALLPPPAAHQVLDMLRDVVDRGTGAAARGLGFPVAGKTGTSDGYRDAWFVGCSSRIVAGVWVGYDRPREIGPDAYAARVAVPLWADFMRRAAAVRPPGPFVPPEGMRAVELCSVSFSLPSDRCPLYGEFLKSGDPEPERPCPLHRGSLRQRVSRAVGGLLERIRGIFRRR